MFACLITTLVARAQDSVEIVAARDLVTVQVQLQTISGQNAPAGIRGYVSVPGTRPQFGSAVSDETGKLKFFLKDIQRPAQLVFQTGAGADSSYRFEVIQPVVQRWSHTDPRGPLSVDTLPFYGYPDRSYHLDDYTRFPTLEEVITEFVPDVKLKKSKGNAEFAVFNLPYMIYQDQPPLILLDGVPVFNVNRLLELDPLKLRRLDVVARKYHLGTLICNGIVALYSYDGGLAGFSLPYNAFVNTVAQQ